MSSCASRFGRQPQAHTEDERKHAVPEMSPLGLILEFDILCPSGILRALTMPFPSKAELKTLQG